MVPVIRRVAREFRDAPCSEVQKLIQSSYHEERLLSLLMLVQLYSKGDATLKKKIYDFYLKSTEYINNWDLVDLSAPNIVGDYLACNNRKPLYEFAKSRDLWKRRIAIMATFQLIKQNEFNETLKISKMLLADDHDLIHKAVGWMLREVGKRDRRTEEQFLQQYYKKMPRTMLRYAIERFPEAKRQRYLNGTV
jgi:3-methyladenine DNA glycosylase AlkD